MEEPLDDYLVEDGDGRRVDAGHTTLGRHDLSTFPAVDQVDLHCSDADWLRRGHVDTDHLYAWHLSANRLELQGSLIGRANLRDMEIANPLDLRRVAAGTVDLTGTDAPATYATDARIDTIRVGGGDGILDLTGAGIGRIVGDIDPYHVTVDDDTYIHDVPDALAADLGYRGLSSSERGLLDRIANYDDAVSYDELQRDHKRAVEYAPVLGPLVQRGFLSHEEDRFQLTQRGRYAAETDATF